MMFKKGQAAMEFLMTYGWAILVVLAAIGALAYFGVLDPANLLPEKCDGSAGMDCLEKASLTSSSNVVAIASKNNLGYDINLTNASLTPNADNTCTAVASAEVSVDGAAAVDITTAPEVENGETFVVSITCGGAGFSSGKFQGAYKISYISENNLPQNALYSIRRRAA
jgi:uncharacterized protein (UPF0333 family)